MGKIQRGILFFSFAVVCLAQHGAALSGEPEPVRVRGGFVAGRPADVEGITLYKAIPFAKPPVGDLRWKAPVDLDEHEWDGVRNPADWPNAQMQPADMFKPGEFWTDEFYYEGAPNPKPSEDGLYLNIYAPEPSDKALHPVMVWFHGGGFDHGNASEVEFNAAKLAAKGVVVVLAQYRLGVFGFLALAELSEEGYTAPDGTFHKISGNYGSLDQVKALEWVRDNIEGFGGDPGRVTIFGQSAGGKSVRTMLSTPLARGLFHNAIIQSDRDGYLSEPGVVPTVFTKLADRERIAAEALKKVFGSSILKDDGGIDLKKLRAIDAETFVNDANFRTFKNAAGRMVLDEYVYTTESIDLMREEALAGIHLMVGGTSDEETSLRGDPAGTMAIDEFFETLAKRYGAGRDAIARLYNPQDETSAYRMNLRSMADEAIQRQWVSARHSAAHNHDHAAYIYYFDHKLPPHAPEISARRDEAFYGNFHSSDLWYVFNSMRDDPLQRLWTDKDYAMGDMVASYWANFAANGDPNGPGLPVWGTCLDEGSFMWFTDGTGIMATSLDKEKDELNRGAVMRKWNMTDADLVPQD